MAIKHLFILIVMFGCANVDMSTDTTSFKSNSEVYPIEPTAQLDHPPAPGQPFEHPAPTVSNAIAYAQRTTT